MGLPTKALSSRVMASLLSWRPLKFLFSLSLYSSVVAIYLVVVIAVERSYYFSCQSDKRVAKVPLPTFMSAIASIIASMLHMQSTTCNTNFSAILMWVKLVS